MAELRVRPSTPIAEGYLESAGERLTPLEEDGNLPVATMPLLNDGTYTVRLLNASAMATPARD